MEPNNTAPTSTAPTASPTPVATPVTTPATPTPSAGSTATPTASSGNKGGGSQKKYLWIAIVVLLAFVIAFAAFVFGTKNAISDPIRALIIQPQPTAAPIDSMVEPTEEPIMTEEPLPTEEEEEEISPTSEPTTGPTEAPTPTTAL